MRILLLAPVHREKEYLKERNRLLFPRFQAQISWIRALEILGNKVFVFRYTDSILIPNFTRIYFKDFFEKLFPIWSARLSRIKSKLYFLSLENFLKNQKLLSLADKIEPDLIIISGGISNTYPSTIKKIKDKFHCRALLFAGVNPTYAATPAEKLIIKSGIIDIVVENDRGYAKRWENLGALRTIVLPISSVDPEIHRKVSLTKEEKSEYECDVCFVGTLTEGRQKILRHLLNNNYSFEIWGDIPVGIKLNDELKPYYNGLAFGEKMVKVFNAAKIVLNFQPNDMSYGGNLRTFEIPGCGAFQLADKVDPDFLIVGQEFVSFKNISDLKNKIRYYLQNQSKRLKIVQTGFKRVHRDHTYEKHFRKLLSQI